MFYTTTSRFVVWLGAFSKERQGLWLTKDDLKDSSSWSSTPLVLLHDIHNDKDLWGCFQGRWISDSQKEEDGTLFLPQLNNLVYQTNLWREDTSNDGPTIPTQHRLTHQILNHWKTLLDLKRTFVVSRRQARRTEQLRLRTH